MPPERCLAGPEARFEPPGGLTVEFGWPKWQLTVGFGLGGVVVFSAVNGMDAGLEASAPDCKERPEAREHSSSVDGNKALSHGPSAAEDYADLWAWQQEAVQAWRDNGRTGVVEAVTGSGKTRVGTAAAFEAVRQGMRVLVLVPTSELQRQWISTLRRDLPGARRGRLGDGHADTLDKCDVLVAIVHSAATRETLRAHKAGLVIADECHRYAAPMFAGALQESYVWRLGLSATYDRADGAHKERLEPFFGKIVHRIWFDRALEDKVIAPFDVALVGIELPSADRERYDELSEVMLAAARNLETYGGVSRLPFAGFIAAVAALSKQDSMEGGLARKYMAAMTSRHQLLAETKSKNMALAALRVPLDEARKTLVFTQTKASAHAAGSICTALGISSAVVMSGMDQGERREALNRFRDGAVKVLAAPQVLDEGIDVPTAELAVVVAASRTERQMVQRLGRVIRRKPGNAPGRLVVLYSRNTVEDPRMQGEGFLATVLPYARNVGRFNIETQVPDIEAFLRLPGVPDPVPLPGTVAPGPFREVDDAGDTEATDPIVEPGPAPFDLEDTEWDLDYDEDYYEADDVKAYLSEIGRLPLLNAKDEVDLAVAIEAGLYAEHLRADGAERTRRQTLDLEKVAADGRAAMDLFYRSNLRLVVSIARRYTSRGLDLLDLFQEGNLGLLRAVQKFDYRTGNKFSTYATWWIRQAVVRGIGDHGRTIRLPIHLVDRIASLQRVARTLEERNDSTPTIAEIAKEAGEDPAKAARSLRATLPLVSLDWDIPDGRGGLEPLANALHDPSDWTPQDYIEHDELIWEVHTLLDGLDPRMAEIMAMRYGLDDGRTKTLEEIGQVYKVTRERIRQLETQAMNHLREACIPGFVAPPRRRAKPTARRESQ